LSRQEIAKVICLVTIDTSCFALVSLPASNRRAARTEILSLFLADGASLGPSGAFFAAMRLAL
jgi:hypothetical protein